MAHYLSAKQYPYIVVTVFMLLKYWTRKVLLRWKVYELNILFWVSSKLIHFFFMRVRGSTYKEELKVQARQ